ncbi:unnamed protein product [Urochloa humidicola]
MGHRRSHPPGRRRLHEYGRTAAGAVLKILRFMGPTLTRPPREAHSSDTPCSGHIFRRPHLRAVSQRRSLVARPPPLTPTCLPPVLPKHNSESGDCKVQSMNGKRGRTCLKVITMG